MDTTGWEIDMAEHLHELTVEELAAACKALGRATNQLYDMAIRMRELDEPGAAHQLGAEEDRISTVAGILLALLRRRRYEEHERAYIESGE